jgi:HEAT repeat protein
LAVLVLMQVRTPAWGADELQRFPASVLDASVRELALGAFSRAIHSGDDDERSTAVEALIWLGDRRAMSPLIRGLRDELWHVRHAAAEGLSALRPLPAWCLEPLARRIDDPEPAVRAAGARALGGVLDLGALPPLVAALDDRHRCVRLEAARALEQLGGAAIFDAEAARRLEQLLVREHDPYVAFAAYWALGAQGGAIGSRAGFRWSSWGQTVWQIVTGT